MSLLIFRGNSRHYREKNESDSQENGQVRKVTRWCGGHESFGKMLTYFMI